MIEPKAFVESWFYIKSLIGFSKGRPVALSPYWKNEINSYLDDIDDTDLLNDLTDHYRDCEGDLFYSLPLKSWFPKKSYCENSNSYKEVDIIVDSAHECPKCLSPDDCKTNKELHSENYSFGEICANFDGITTFFEPLIKGSNRFLIVDYIFGQKFDAKHTKKAGKIVEERGKKVRKKKEQWDSIPDLINFIFSLKKNAIIEIHTCCEDGKKRSDLRKFLLERIGAGKKSVIVNSWCRKNLRGTEDKEFKKQPHDRYFLTDSTGVKLGIGFDYGNDGDEISYNMLSREQVRSEHENWVPKTSPYEIFWSETLP